MALFDVQNVAIKGVAACVPARREENASLALFSGDEAEKFSSSTGVYFRRLVDKNTTTSDLCFHAAEKLVQDLGWEKSSIDCLIFVTQTPDYRLPATSCILQDRLGLSRETYAIDISLGCSGWIYGLCTLGKVLSPQMKRGLLLVGDTTTKEASKEDKSSYPLFGDAGTATALEFDETNGALHFHVATDGSGYEAIIVPEGGSRNPVTPESFIYYQAGEGIRRNRLHAILNGMDVFTFGITKAPQSVNKLLEAHAIAREDVDYFLFHQANLFMNEKIRKKLKLREDQVPYSLRDFGNTSSATIPLTMVTQMQDALKTRHLRNVGCGFGVGLSWGTVYFETNGIVCPDLIEV